MFHMPTKKELCARLWGVYGIKNTSFHLLFSNYVDRPLRPNFEIPSYRPGNGILCLLKIYNIERCS